VRDELRKGIVEPSVTERESWARLTPGDEVLSNVGAQPLDPRAGAEFYERTGAQPALDVNEVTGGQPRTVIPSVATATLTLRLAPRQDSREMCAALERLLREAAPDGAEVEITFNRGEPALFEPSEPALQLASQAIARACGTDPVFVRTGGSIPVVAEMATVGMPTIVSGFTLPDDAFHAPNESYMLRSLELGEASARELLVALAAVPRR
jgi:acetylornithine deacetylase/succinyl-diaminopimelate desuccinylase-like protein